MTDHSPPSLPSTNPATSPAAAGRNRHPIPRLDSLEAVRREMARIYRAVRNGEIATQDGTRLIFILAHIARLIEGGELERRLAALEEYHE